MRRLAIDWIVIDDDSDCYVIAEIGHNHQGDLSIAKDMIEAAAWAGCDAVKFQKRDNKTLYTEEYYNSPYNSENAFGRTYGEHREALEFDFDQYRELQTCADDIGITFFATAFDKPSLDFLVELNVPAIKIASGDITNRALIADAVASRRPVIISTGGADLADIWDTRIECVGDAPAAFLHCTSGYPAAYDELNLRAIDTLRCNLSNVIGWSGHDTGIAMAPVAYTLGARIIEKHFTLNRSWKGTDQAMSLEPQGMRTMIDNLAQCKEALGDGIKRRYDSEAKALAKQWKNAEGKIDGRCILP